MSQHLIEIIEIGKIIPHPDPEVDRLEITHMWGWQCCIGKDQFKEGDKAVYIPPDYVIKTVHPSFSFLAKDGKKTERIKVRRFKGVLSQGLLISVPDDLKDLPVGTNVIDQLGIERYEPPLPKQTGSDFVSAPSDLYVPKFDIESYQRYRDKFEDGEEILATEKIHGANSRFTFAQDKEGEWKQFCGSRTNWMDESEKIIWWQAFNQCSGIGKWCEANPTKIIYGEVFGQVQNLKYGAGTNDIFFAAFGILEKNTWLDYDKCQMSILGFGIKWAPLVHRGPFDETLLLNLAEGDSEWPGAKHMKEGVVIIPVHERIDKRLGRVALKMVSNRYLEKGK